MFKFVKKHFATSVVLCLGIIATIIVCVYAFYVARAHAIFAASHPATVVKYLNIHAHSLYSLLAIFFCGLAISVLLSLFFALKQREKKLVLDKHYLEQLAVSERKYQILFDTSRDAIMTLNPPNWSFTSGNKATIEMFKCKDEKHFISFAPYELSPDFQPDGKSSKEKSIGMINAAMEKGSYFFDWMHKRAGGEEFPATVLLTRVEIEKDHPFLQATVRDVTEGKKAEKIILEKTHQLEDLNKRLEEKVAERTAELNKKNIQLQDAHSKLKDSISSLMQVEKLSVIGEFAAGTVHELNNPLTGALNFVQYVLKHTEQSDKKYSILKDTEREIMRCIGIVKNLLSFARGGKEQQEDIVAEKISTIFERVLLLLAYRVKKDNVEIKTHFPENPLAIFMQPNKMQQMFLNLLTNAMDALLDSETKKINITEEYKNGMMVITIEDTGCGIEPDKLNKIYSPFFTTKPKGVGTGLGLSIVSRIIEDHHGKIECESQLGKGTRFIITLPLRQKEDNAHG